MIGLIGSVLGKLITHMASYTSALATALGTACTNITTLVTNYTSTRAGYIDTINSNAATLISRLTSGRATALDHLDADISSISGGETTTIYRGVAYLADTTTTTTVTIPAVTMNKTSVHIVGVFCNANAASQGLSHTMVAGYLNSTTQIIFIRGAGQVSDSVTIRYEYWVRS